MRAVSKGSKRNYAHATVSASYLASADLHAGVASAYVCSPLRACEEKCKFNFFISSECSFFFFFF